MRRGLDSRALQCYCTVCLKHIVCFRPEQSPFAMDYSYLEPSSPDAFFCQFKLVEGCISATDFVSRGFQRVCPSGDCIADCSTAGTMYQNITQELAEEFIYTDVPPLYAICLAAPSMARSIQNGLVPDPAATVLRPYFPSVDEVALQAVASTTTHCLTSTCDQARFPLSCDLSCTTSMLVNSSTPSLSGVNDCLAAMCSSNVAIPFANQDVVGIGVCTSVYP